MAGTERDRGRAVGAGEPAPPNRQSAKSATLPPQPPFGECAMYLNAMAPGTEPVDMTATDEFPSLVQSARELGIATPKSVRYRSRNVVVNGLRFHALEWG